MSAPRPLLTLAACALPIGLAAVAAPAHADTATATSSRFQVSMSPTTAKPGETVTFTVKTTNIEDNYYRIMNFALRPDSGGVPFTGPGTCTLTSGRAPSTCGVDTGGNALAVTYGADNRMPPRASSTVTITTTVKQNAAPRTYALKPDGRTSQNLEVPQTFTPATLPFTVPASAADVAVALTATAPTQLGGPITYTQTATNNGPGPLTDATVTTRLPAQTTAVTGLPTGCAFDATAKTVACTTGSLAVGAARPATFQATLGALSLGLSLPATATRTTSTPTDPNGANDTATTSCTVVTGLIIRC